MASKKHDVLYEKGRDNLNSDIWDDTALIMAYDEAVNAMQGKLMERGIDTTNGSKNQRTKKKKKQRKKSTREHKIELELMQEHVTQHEWNVGDHCRAVYTEDGNIYGAVIVEMDEDLGTCYVRYLGYGNEEEQMLIDLMKSSAAASSYTEHDSYEEKDDSGAESVRETTNEQAGSHSKSSRTSKRGTRRGGRGKSRSHQAEASVPHNTYPFGGMGGMFAPPPPPPPPPPTFGAMPFQYPFPGVPPPAFSPMMPPFMFSPQEAKCAQNFAPPPLEDLDEVVSDKEALHSMLISWYMSGYHTGYYQGLKAGKSTKKEKDSKEEKD